MKYLHYIILWIIIILIMIFYPADNQNNEEIIHYKEIDSNVSKKSSGSGTAEISDRTYVSFKSNSNKEERKLIAKESIGQKSKLISDLRKIRGDGNGFGAFNTYGNRSYRNAYNNSYSEKIKEKKSISLINTGISTFSIDVDTASYKYVKNALNRANNVSDFRYFFDGNNLRIEEMVNYFDYDYPLPEKEAFNVITEISKLPFEKDKYILHIGIKGKEEKTEKIPPANLIFLIDTSWSMDSEHKLPLIKKSLTELTKNLRNIDKITILTYNDNASLYLETTSGDKKDIIINKLNELKTEGSTNGEAGLKLSYKKAEETFIKGGINRIILCTDGGFNAGTTNSEELKELIKSYKKKEIALTTLAFSENNVEDDLLKKLSSSGNGNYYYINDFNEAIKVLSTQLTSTLNIIAKDVKVQVEFNAENIKNYKLLGYETKVLNTEDFANDEVDANELGNGHSVTALYEIQLNKEKINNRYKIKDEFQNELAVVNIRYKEPNENKSKEVNKIINKTDIIEDFKKTSDNYKFSLAVAYFGLFLKYQVDESYINLTVKLAKISKGTDKYGYKEEFIQMLEKFKFLSNPYDFYIEGDLIKDDFLKNLTEKTTEFEQCYDKHVKNNEEPIIQKKFQIKINKYGVTYFTHIFNYNEKNDNFENCLLNKIKQLKFSKKEKETLVNFTVNFNQKILNSTDKVEIYF